MEMASEKREKTHLGIVIVGHVDAGKSTTTGRLLFELGGMSERELAKLRKEARELGKASFLFAFFMDKSPLERGKGVTIACTTREFFTDSYHYSIIDAPGHKDFIKNMISGASQADVALLMVPANKGAFESSIAKGKHKTGEVQGQTRQHARLCHLLGIEQMIVGVNKMDDTSVQWSEARFEEIKREVAEMLTRIGYKVKKIPFIPMSGFHGDNLAAKSANMAWWKGFAVKIKKKNVQGVTLVDALERVVRPPKRADAKPFRMPVSGVMKIKGVGDVVTGRVEQGTLSANDCVRFYPTGCAGTVFSIEMHHQSAASARCGDNIGVNVRKLPRDNMPRTGDMMAVDDLKADPRPPRAAKQFTALVYVQDHPGQLTCGFTPSVHIRTASAPCQMASIAWKMGKATGGAKVEEARFIEAGDQAEVVFRPKRPLVVQPFDECRPLARIAAMNSNSLVLLGKVISVTYEDR